MFMYLRRTLDDKNIRLAAIVPLRAFRLRYADEFSLRGKAASCTARDSCHYAYDANERASMNILIVDDDSIDVYFLRELLTEADAGSSHLVHVENLNIALKQLQEEPFDIVLLDFFLPGSQGLESLHRLREQTPDVPIVFMTGLNDENLGHQMIEGGAQGTSSKDRSKAQRCCARCTISLPSIRR